MKTINRILALLLALSVLLSLAACSSEAKTEAPAAAPAASEAAPEAKEETSVSKAEACLRIGTIGSIDGVNGTTENGTFGKMNYTGLCMTPFVVSDENVEVQPYFMTSWDIQEDGTVMLATFATDKGLTWHDGEPVTMDDIIFTFNYLKESSSYYVSEMETIEKIDETTAKMTFPNGKAFTVLNSIANWVKVYPKHIWEKVEGDYKEYTGDDGAIGCGPFKLASYDLDAQLLVYESVGENYFGKPAFEKVSVKSYDSQDALAMAIRNNEIDAMYAYAQGMSATMAPSITGIADVDPGMSINSGNFQMLFGMTKDPTSDLSFRQAVRSALNYDLLCAAVGGEGAQVAGTGLISPPNKGFDPTLPKLAQDVEKSKQLLADAGYADKDGDGFVEMPDGTALEVLITPQYNTTRQPIYLRTAEIIIADLKEIGVNAVLDEESVRNSDHEKQIRKEGGYNLYIGYNTPGVAMFDTAFFYVNTCSTPEFNSAFQAKLDAKSLEEYNAAVMELQKVNDEQVIAIALCWDNVYFPYRTDSFDNWINFPGWGVINYKTWSAATPIA